MDSDDGEESVHSLVGKLKIKCIPILFLVTISHLHATGVHIYNKPSVHTKSILPQRIE